MKIKEYEEREDGYIIYHTDSTEYPRFAYHKTKFKNSTELMKEINKKISIENTKKIKKEEKLNKIKTELNITPKPKQQ